jgi:hypothetical protein
LLVGWLPLGGIAVGAVLIGFGAWRWRRARGPDDEPEPDAETEQRIDELLARFE